MIHVTRLNGTHLTINALLIETMEATPDTVITLVTGNKYIVKQSVSEVVQLVQDYMRQINVIKTSVMSQQREG